MSEILEREYIVLGTYNVCVVMEMGVMAFCVRSDFVRSPWHLCQWYERSEYNVSSWNIATHAVCLVCTQGMSERMRTNT